MGEHPILLLILYDLQCICVRRISDMRYQCTIYLDIIRIQIAYDMCSFHISGIKEPVAQIVTTHLDLALVPNLQRGRRRV